MRKTSIRNKYVLTAVAFAAAAGVVAGAYAAAPLSRLFSRVTGYGAATKVAEGPSPARWRARVFRVKFGASVERHAMDLPAAAPRDAGPCRRAGGRLFRGGEQGQTGR